MNLEITFPVVMGCLLLLVARLSLQSRVRFCFTYTKPGICVNNSNSVKTIISEFNKRDANVWYSYNSNSNRIWGSSRIKDVIPPAYKRLLFSSGVLNTSGFHKVTLAHSSCTKRNNNSTTIIKQSTE